jgi:hypothetical protein
MTALSLREAAARAKASKSTIWRAIKAGRMNAARTDDGGFAIDPAELFRAFPPDRIEKQGTMQTEQAVCWTQHRMILRCGATQQRL